MGRRTCDATTRATGDQCAGSVPLTADQIIDMKHALVKLARTIDWGFLEQTFGAVYTDKPGQPPLPTRLMAGLATLKHTYDLSDEALCDRWVEDPYFQYFCGEEFFQHALVFDRSSLTRWRHSPHTAGSAVHTTGGPARLIVPASLRISNGCAPSCCGYSVAPNLQSPRCL